MHLIKFGREIGHQKKKCYWLIHCIFICKSSKKQLSSRSTLPDKQLAVSEGDGLTLVCKRSLISAQDNVVTGAQDAQLKGHVGDAAAAVSNQSIPQQWMSYHLE